MAWLAVTIDHEGAGFARGTAEKSFSVDHPTLRSVGCALEMGSPCGEAARHSPGPKIGWLLHVIVDADETVFQLHVAASPEIIFSGTAALMRYSRIAFS